MRSRTSVLIAGLAVLVLVLALGAAPALAVDNSFTTGTDWNTTTNWSLGHVPLATEDVKIITAGANPTLSNSGANGVAKSVTIGSSNSLIVDNRTLSVGTGASSIAGSIQIRSGGIVALTGTTTVTNTGGPASPAIVFNSGTGFLDINSGGTLDMSVNAAAVLNQASGSVHVAPGGSLTYGGGGPDGGYFQVPVDNDGSVTATNGRLLMSGGTTSGQQSSGTFTATSPGTLAYQGATELTTTGKMTGTGTMEFSTGTATIPAGSTASPSPYNPATTSFTGGGLSLGTDGSTGALTSTGGTRTGAATLTVTGSSTITAFGTNLSGGTTNLNGATTINAGVQVTSTLNINGNATLGTGGGINVASGALNVGNGGALDVVNNVNIFNAGSGSMHVLAGGTLKRTTAGTDGQIGIPFTNAGTVSVDAGRLTFSGAGGLTQTGGVTDVKGNELNGTVDLQGGTLKGTGTLGGPVNNTGGTVAPGASPGLLTISGAYTQGSGGTLQEEITGTALSAFDRLAVGGAVSLDGTLAIQSSFTPASTDTFKIIGGSSSRTGTFSSVTGASFSGGSYEPQYDSDGVTLKVAGSPPPPLPPSNNVPPSIPGAGQTGDAIACDPGSWTGSPTFTFSWTRDDVVISGQTGSSYTLTADDAGHAIRCLVVATNGGGSTGPVASNALTASAPPSPTPSPTPAPTPVAASAPAPAPTPSPDVKTATSTPRCLSIPAITRNQVAPVRGGGKVVLLTSQVDDPANPLRVSVRFVGRGAIRAVAFKANAKALTASGNSAAVPTGTLKIGGGRNRFTATVTLRDGRKASVTQFLAIVRCPLPAVKCLRLADGRSLRCSGGTPLRARRVTVTVTRSARETARGTATVTRGRYTVTVHASTALPLGKYAYKYVATTARRGEKFQVIRLVTVA